MPKFKRELVPGAYLTAADMLHTLAQQQLVAAALADIIVLAAEPALAWLLDRCCVGRPVPNAAVSTTSDSNSSSAVSLASLAAAADAAGVNRASPEVLLQFEQHQAQQLARKQRRARRTPGYVATAGITAPAATAGQPAAAAAAAEHELGVQQGDDVQGMTAADSADAANTGDTEEADGVAGGEAGNGWPAGSSSGMGAALPISMEELQQLQLVQLSFQEAFFLAHVLQCCSVFAVQQSVPEDNQQQQQQHEHHIPQVEQLQAQEQQQQQQQRQLVQGPLTPAELWRWCCSAAPGGALQFVSRYACYKHFRSKGWLPLPGLLYGADYALYKLHPEWAHSDFLVLVMVERPAAAAAGDAGAPAAAAAAAAVAASCAEGQHHQQQQQQHQAVMVGNGGKQQQQFGLQFGPGIGAGSSVSSSGVSSRAGGAGGSTQLAWLDAHIMQRLARQVLKQLLLLYVVVPAGLELGSIECMQQLAVREVLLQRWVPSEHREDGKA